MGSQGAFLTCIMRFFHVFRHGLRSPGTFFPARNKSKKQSAIVKSWRLVSDKEAGLMPK
jgi:hypothetical protein